MFFALKGANFNGNEFARDALDKGARFAIIDEETYQTNPNCILVDDVLKTLQRLATFHRKFLKTLIITLTGSNGKTTTKELINAVLSTTFKTTATKGNLNNHIGVPLTLLEFTSATEIGIVEMGANHQKEIEFLSELILPDYGLITNFGKAHLEGFGGFEGVIKGKSELYDHLKHHNKLIFVNNDDHLQLQQLGDYDKIITFGDQTKFIDANPYVRLEFNGVIINSNLTGAYNYNNIVAAITIGLHFNVSQKNIINAIENYIPNNNRSQIIEQNSNKIILDAYNANPSSMVVALDNFGKLDAPKKVAILGDMFELGATSNIEHQYISEYAQKFDIDHIFLVGENFYTTMGTSKSVLRFKTFNDLNAFVKSHPIAQSNILIKGSRGMALERILDCI